MSTEVSLIIRAVDEASEVVRKVAAETSGALEEVGKASERVAQAHSLSWRETKNLVTGFSGLATSAFALYSAIDRVQDAQLNLQRANLMVQASQLELEKAQKKLNDAVNEYNMLEQKRQDLLATIENLRIELSMAMVEEEASEKRIAELRKQLDAATKEYNKTVERMNELSSQIPQLQDQAALAQEKYNYTVEKAQQIHENYNQMVIQTALSTVPMLITAVDSGIKAFNGIKSAIEMVNVALTFLAANPIMLVIMAIGALIGALVWLYQTNEGFRNAVNALGETLYNFFKPILDAIIGAFTWFYENVLKPIGDFIVNYFLVYWKALGIVWDKLKEGWDAFCGALKWGYDTFIKPIADALMWFFEHVVKPIWDFFAGLAGKATTATGVITGGRGPRPRGAPGARRTGAREETTAGEILTVRPEAIIPVAPAPQQNIVNISLNVEGSVDKRTAEYVINEIEKKLKTVLIEPSSSAAPTNRIRLPREAI